LCLGVRVARDLPTFLVFLHDDHLVCYFNDWAGDLIAVGGVQRSGAGKTGSEEQGKREVLHR